MIQWSCTLRCWRVSNSTPANRDPARSDAQAKTRLLGVLNRSLSTVCGRGIWMVTPATGGSFAAVTNPPVVPLKTNNDRIYLRSTVQFTYVDNPRYPGERKAATHQYAHTVGESDTLRPQLYSWEWAATEPTYPHLHLRRSDPAFEGLGKLHIPTGRVFYEDVLRFLIQEHGVEPVRDDWDDVLKDSFSRVSTYATWGGGRRT